MSERQRKTALKHRQNAIPAGRIAAILTGCAVTLIGIVNNLEPDVLLFRVVIATLIVGFGAAVLARTLLLFLK